MLFIIIILQLIRIMNDPQLQFKYEIRIAFSLKMVAITFPFSLKVTVNRIRHENRDDGMYAAFYVWRMMPASFRSKNTANIEQWKQIS